MVIRLARGEIPAFAVPLLVFLCVVVTACGTGPVPTARFDGRVFPTIVVTPGLAPTLPPTWTPLPTATPRPTATPTRSPTPVPTLTAQQVCNDFQVLSAPTGQHESEATVTFAWRGVPIDAAVALSITKHDAKEGLRISLPIAGDSVFRLPLSRLPEEGDYDWTIALQHPIYGAICTQSGSFTRKPAPFI